MDFYDWAKNTGLPVLTDFVKWTIGFFTKYYVPLLILIFLILILYPYLLKENADVLQSAPYIHYIFMGIPIIILLAFIFKNLSLMSGSLLDNKMLILKMVGAVMAIIAVSVAVSQMKTDSNSVAAIMFFANIIIGLSLLFGLILVGRAVKDIAYSLEGWIGIVARILFFIPCMLSDLFNYTLGQFAKSPFVVYVLLAIEIVLILAYFYIPKMLAQYAQKSVYKVRKEPIMLQNETVISSLANVLIKEGNPPIPASGSTWNNCSISLWFYILGMPKNQYPYNEEGAIFELTESHPKIVYDGRTNVCRVYYAKNAPAVEFKFALQKWVHFVIVYDTYNIDIFVDGVLTKSVPRKDVVVTTKPSDLFKVGQQNGLQGSVCNIVHSKDAISKFQISYMHDLNKYSNPPIV